MIQKVNGAAAILNDDIRQEIAEKVGDFLHVAFFNP